MEVLPHLVADATEQRKPLLFATFERCRICKAPVNHGGLTGKDRAAFPGVVADGQHVVEWLASELLYALGTMAGNVDA